MTPRDLSASLSAAIAAEFPDWQPGQPAVYPAAYLNSGVFVVAPNGQKEPRSATLCATNRGATELAQVLDDCGRNLTVGDIVLLPAMDLQGGWKDSESVPWFDFGHGVTVNAGPLICYFIGNLPSPIIALNSCQCDIERARADAGQRGPVTDDEIAKIMAQR